MTPLALAVVAVVAVVAFGSRPSSGRPSSRPSSGRPTGTTVTYARGKVQTLESRFRDPAIARAVERWAPQFLPGVPLEAVIALGASSMGAREQLNTPPGAWGLFGVEPQWIDDHGADDTTRRELGRTVTRASYPRDIAGQVYLGLRRYAAALRAARAVGADVDLDSWGPWEYLAAVCAYSAGEGRLRELLRLAPVAARHEPRAQRWTRIAEDTYDRITDERSQPLAWALIRPRERYQSALALRARLNLPSSWYQDVEAWPTEQDVTLSNIAHRRT